ncbi:hypothetical protein V5O48_008213 [Marasmius crinis-equi]|uniref:Uncharacterized protein n=1 Tax=Marasmius crinis-equi TaxID=585013 RepID=A0ABR3FEI4_9AGAR
MNSKTTALAICFLTSLTQKLPNTVKIAGPDDRIAHVFKAVPESNLPLKQWEVFVQQMDLLFGEDVRDSKNNLANITGGPQGMDCVGVKRVQ